MIKWLGIIVRVFRVGEKPFNIVQPETVGTSKNAVMTQIWIALCVYLMLAYLKYLSKIRPSMQQMIRLLQLNLFARRDLLALLCADPPKSQSYH